MNNKSEKNIMEEEHKNLVQNSEEFTAMSEAATKKVTVEIDTADLSVLKECGYSLCFAKKVGAFDYDVIWKSFKKYGADNIFSWQPLYYVYGMNYFNDNVKVVASTNIVNIGLNETTTIDKYGVLTNPIIGGVKNAINVDNEYGNIHIGISQLSIDVNGQMESTPIYVSKGQALIGKSSYEPLERVLIWFQKGAETGIMFAGMRSNAIEIDLTERDSAKVMYMNGHWAFI